MSNVLSSLNGEEITIRNPKEMSLPIYSGAGVTAGENLPQSKGEKDMGNILTTRNKYPQQSKMIGFYTGTNCPLTQNPASCGAFCFTNKQLQINPIPEKEYLNRIAAEVVNFDLAAVVGITPFLTPELTMKILREIDKAGKPSGVITPGWVKHPGIVKLATWIDVSIHPHNERQALNFIKWASSKTRVFALTTGVSGFNDWLPGIIPQIKAAGALGVAVGNLVELPGRTIPAAGQDEMQQTLEAIAGMNTPDFKIMVHFDYTGTQYQTKDFALPVLMELQDKNRHMLPDGVLRTDHPTKTFNPKPKN